MSTSEREYLRGLFEDFKAELLAAVNERPDDRPLMTTRDVARGLSVDERTARGYIESGRLPSVKIEGVRRVRPVDYDRFAAGLPAVDPVTGARP